VRIPDVDNMVFGSGEEKVAVRIEDNLGQRPFMPLKKNGSLRSVSLRLLIDEYHFAKNFELGLVCSCSRQSAMIFYCAFPVEIEIALFCEF
jgi:hypothetical protein